MHVVVLRQYRKTYNYDSAYVNGLNSFAASPAGRALGVKVTVCNSRWGVLRYARALLRADVIVLLHSIDPTLIKGLPPGPTAAFLQKCPGKVVYFPRNEYKVFHAKRDFLVKAGVDLVCSQLDDRAAQFLYGDLAPTISSPHALDTAGLPELPAWPGRPIDVGTISALYPAFLLNDGRNNLAALFPKLEKCGFKVHFANSESQRLPYDQWLRFLGDCRFTAASEAGASYVSRDDKLLNAISEWRKRFPEQDEDEVAAHFADQLAPLPSGLTVSSRHFEAAGMGVVQVLVEGEYCGIFQPGEHYVPLRRDGSNLEEVVETISDSAAMEAMSVRTRAHILAHHTHERRWACIFDRLGAIN